MSRTYKDRSKCVRVVKNSLYKKVLNLWGEDFIHRRKDRALNRRLKRNIKRK